LQLNASYKISSKANSRFNTPTVRHIYNPALWNPVRWF